MNPGAAHLVHTPTFHVVETERSLEEVTRSIRMKARSHGLEIMNTCDIGQKLGDWGVPYGRECRVIEVCNPASARALLEHQPAIATVLPCRVALYEHEGRTRLAAVLPTALIGCLMEPGLMAPAEKLEENLLALLEDLTRPLPVLTGFFPSP